MDDNKDDLVISQGNVNLQNALDDSYSHTSSRNDLYYSVSHENIQNNLDDNDSHESVQKLNNKSDMEYSNIQNKDRQAFQEGYQKGFQDGLKYALSQTVKSSQNISSCNDDKETVSFSSIREEERGNIGSPSSYDNKKTIGTNKSSNGGIALRLLIYFFLVIPMIVGGFFGSVISNSSVGILVVISGILIFFAANYSIK